MQQIFRTSLQFVSSGVLNAFFKIQDGFVVACVRVRVSA